MRTAFSLPAGRTANSYVASGAGLGRGLGTAGYGGLTRKDPPEIETAAGRATEGRVVPIAIPRQGTLSPRRVGATIQVSPQRRNGVWKAKVVIGSKQLGEILAVEGNTHALIDQLRIAAAEASASEIVGGRNLSSRKSKESYFC